MLDEVSSLSVLSRNQKRYMSARMCVCVADGHAESYNLLCSGMQWNTFPIEIINQCGIVEERSQRHLGSSSKNKK